MAAGRRGRARGFSLPLTMALAFSLMSLACDLHISQMVNGPCGVHAMIPKAVLPE